VAAVVGVLGVSVAPAFAALGCTGANCAINGSTNAGNVGDGTTLEDTIKLIINLVIYAIGFVAVAMVILGGVQYSTSSGDATKVKKAKDTILYGIIGLVVAILAFAIVNFVLDGVFG
jgi:hypothetical protein